MHEYDRLYQRWKKYRLKKVVKSSLLSVLFILVITGLLFTFQQTTKKEQITKHNPIHTNIILPQKEFEKKLKAPKFTYKIKKKRYKKTTISKPPSEKTPHKTIFIKNDQVDINELKRLFFKAPTPSKALIIAKRYYVQKKYKDAAAWALKANELDKSNKESWLLFAKSLAKQGKKREAINVLQIYYKKSGSSDAKLLMQDIINGAFK